MLVAEHFPADRQRFASQHFRLGQLVLTHDHPGQDVERRDRARMLVAQHFPLQRYRLALERLGLGLVAKSRAGVADLMQCVSDQRVFLTQARAADPQSLTSHFLPAV